MTKLTILPALLLLALPALQSQQPTRSVELQWGELAPLFGNQRVKLALPDGAVIAGEAITVREDTLVIDVKKTSDKKAHPKDYSPIPRESVTLFEVDRRCRKGARAIGATVGVVSGVFGGGYVTAKLADQTAAGFLATCAGVASASSVGGFLVGKEIDTDLTYVKVVE